MAAVRRKKLDFTGVEAYVKCAEGQHVVKLIEIEEGESQAGNDMLSATFQVVKGTSTGAKLYDNFVLTEKALWKLQSFLVAVGMKADGKIVLDLDKLIGKTCIVEVVHEEYEGKTRARIQEFLKLNAKKAEDEDEDDEDLEDEDFEEDEEEEEEPAPKKKAKPAAKPAGKAAKTSPKPASKSKKKPVEDDDDWDDDEDWDDED
jgi:hypothetical protein